MAAARNSTTTTEPLHGMPTTRRWSGARPAIGLTALLLCLGPEPGSVAGPNAAPIPIAVSKHPQLFLDDRLVARMTGLRRELQVPVKRRNPVIVQDQPWEKRLLSMYGTVAYDEARRKYRGWYLGSEFKDGIPDVPEGPRTAEYYQCYAESDDGVRWRKPLVGEGAFGSHSRHNVVLREGHGFCILPTPEDNDPARRFRGVGGATLGFSPDGLRWQTQRWTAVGKNDTGTSVVHWNSEYLAYVRYQEKDPKWPAVMRAVGISRSPDFLAWTPKTLVFKTDAEDGYPWTQPYGLSVTPYGDQLIGLLWLLHLDRREGNNSFGDMDVQLIVSRDGLTWHRVADRAVFLKPTPGTWDAGRVFPATTLLVKDDQVSVYYTGARTRHGEEWSRTGIGLATLPADRFVALRPTEAGKPGILETPLMTFKGRELLVNAGVHPRDLQVEALDTAGKVLPGFDRGNCRLISRDRLRFRVRWKGPGSEGAPLPVDRPMALRFILRHGALFSFTCQ